jgi:phosphatidylglycerol:prolipoprotein diacylglycerol transferase
MYPILGRYGPFFLYSYTVVVGLGVLAGIGLAAWLERGHGRPDWFDGVLISLAAGLVGGRLGFVLSQWEYYEARWHEIGQVWQGGLSYHGALLAGMAALWLWWRARHQGQEAFAAYAEPLMPGFTLGNVFGWLACWLAGCAYGRESVGGFFVSDLPDSFGVYALRYQTQWLGMGLSLLVFLLLLALRRRWPPAMLFWLALLGLSGGRVLVSLLRGDPAPQVGFIRLDTIIDGIVALISLLLLQYWWLRSR